MTCGGANMLFGVEDKLKSLNPDISIESYGQELRGSLFALAKIESMFRKGAFIEHGNTLTDDKFLYKTFDFGVANPPYGVSWKEEQKAIQNDQTGRFGHGGYPSVGDGQLLFVQQMVAHLNEEGKAFVVLNGSPLFSGDAGSGESNIRKWILDHDYLEALIQLPTNEFFNTGISTYIWCLNKSKDASRKDQILLINAEDDFEKLKKNKGNKSKEVSESKAKDIAETYRQFKVSPTSKVISKYDFYFNKQSLKKIEKDEEFGFLAKNKKLTDIHAITFYSREALDSGVSSVDSPNLAHSNSIDYSNSKPGLIGNIELPCESDLDLGQEFDRIMGLIQGFNHEDQVMTLYGESTQYYLDENHCIIQVKNGVMTNLGYGNIKCKVKHAVSTKKSTITFDLGLEQVWTKDNEKIGYDEDANQNQDNIEAFMSKWVSSDKSDYELLDNGVGVEINFNTVFPKKINIRDTATILAEMALLDAELGEL